mmetsp:Transcript_24865/g.63448  ORF Transcript_24865/g.63448 Transcript_24865/m.63448 type:complete len:280 (+) Transcript_24865:70-909(+)
MFVPGMAYVEGCVVVPVYMPPAQYMYGQFPYMPVPAGAAPLNRRRATPTQRRTNGVPAPPLHFPGSERHLIYVCDEVFRSDGVVVCDDIARRLQIGHIKRFKSVEKLETWLRKNRGSVKRGLQPILIRGGSGDAGLPQRGREDSDRFPVVVWSADRYAPRSSVSDGVVTVHSLDECVEQLSAIYEDEQKKSARSTAAGSEVTTSNSEALTHTEASEAEFMGESSQWSQLLQSLSEKKNWADFSSSDEDGKKKDKCHVRMHSGVSTAPSLGLTSPPVSPR